MSPRTLTKPPDDKLMWRRAVARAHRDAGGDDELFVWLQNVREHICKGGTTQATSLPPRQGPLIVREEGRVPFPEPADFEALTRKAMVMADFDVPPLYADLLRLLEGCKGVDYEPSLRQRRGASYRQLAAICHLVGMSKPERVRWYRVAESVPLAGAHAGHILDALKGRRA